MRQIVKILTYHMISRFDGSCVDSDLKRVCSGNFPKLFKFDQSDYMVLFLNNVVICSVDLSNLHQHDFMHTPPHCAASQSC